MKLGIQKCPLTAKTIDPHSPTLSRLPCPCCVGWGPDPLCTLSAQFVFNGMPKCEACGAGMGGTAMGSSSIYVGANPVLHHLGNYPGPGEIYWCIHTSTFYLIFAPMNHLFHIFLRYILHFGPIFFTNGAHVAHPSYTMGHVSTLLLSCSEGPLLSEPDNPNTHLMTSSISHKRL